LSVIDNKKYLTSILLVSAVGVILHLAIDQHVWHAVHNLGTLLQAIKNLYINIKGPSDIWKFVGSGGTLAAVYVWLFEKVLWKIPLLQGWMVRFPNLGGTWVGVLTIEALRGHYHRGTTWPHRKPLRSVRGWGEQEKYFRMHKRVPIPNHRASSQGRRSRACR